MKSQYEEYEPVKQKKRNLAFSYKIDRREKSS